MILLPGDVIPVDTEVRADSKQEILNKARKVIHTGSMLNAVFSGAMYYYQTNGNSAASFILDTEYPIDVSYRQDKDSYYLASFANTYQLPPVILYNNSDNYYFDDFILDYRFNIVNGMKALWSGSNEFGISNNGILEPENSFFEIIPDIIFASNIDFKVESLFTTSEFLAINNPDLSLRLRESTNEVSGFLYTEELLSTSGGRYIVTLAPSGGYFTDYNSTPEVTVSSSNKRGFFGFFDPFIESGFKDLADNSLADFFPGTTVTGYIDLSISGYLVTASSTQTYKRPSFTAGISVTRSGEVLTNDTYVDVYWNSDSDSITFTGASNFQIVNTLTVFCEYITITPNGSNWDYTLAASPSPFSVSPGRYIVDSLTSPTFTGVIDTVIDSNTFSLESNTGVTSGTRFIILNPEDRADFPNQTEGGKIPFTQFIDYDSDVIDPRYVGYGTIDYQIFYQTTPTGSLSTQALSLEQEVVGSVVTRSSNTGFSISYHADATMFSGIGAELNIRGQELEEFRYYSAQTSGLDNLFSTDFILYGLSGIKIDEVSSKGIISSGVLNYLDYTFDLGNLATIGTSPEEIYNYALNNLNLYFAVGEDNFAYLQVETDIYKFPLSGSLFPTITGYNTSDPNINVASGLISEPLYDFSYNRSSGGFLQYTSYNETLNEVNIKTLSITGSVPSINTRQLFLDVPDWIAKEFIINKKPKASSFYLHGLDHNSLYINTPSGSYVTSTGNLAVSGSNGNLYDFIVNTKSLIAFSGTFIQTSPLEYFIVNDFNQNTSFTASYNIDVDVPAFAGVNLSDTSLRAGTSDSSTVTTQVINAWGDTLSGVLVQYDVILGDGVVVPQNSTTNLNGESTTTFNVGTTPGQVTIRGTVSD